MRVNFYAVVVVLVLEALVVDVLEVGVVVDVPDVDGLVELVDAAGMSMFVTPDSEMTLLPTSSVGPLGPLVTPVTTPVICAPLASTPVTDLPRSDAASLS